MPVTGATSQRLAGAMDASHPLAAVWEHSPVGLAIAALDGTLLQVNPAFCRMLGYAEAELLALRWLDILHPDDVVHDQARDADIRSGALERFELGRRFIAKDGRQLHLQLHVSTLRDETGRVDRLLGVAQDITEHVEAQQRLAHAAMHDALTELPNRRWFVDALRRTLECPRGRDTAVLFLDLDHFKTVNDTIGHQQGDRFLVQAAARIRGCLEPGSLMARYGGDEFVILVPGPDAAGRARALASRLHAALHDPLELLDRQVYCTVSVGLALAGVGSPDAQALMRNADIALYQAKERGRSCTVEFDTSMATQVADTLALQTDLRRAVSRSELRLLYQPIVELESRKAVGFEALLRWEHPDRGLLSPCAFLHTAETGGLGPELGHWALGEATRAARRLTRGRRRPHVSVNLSRCQLADPGLLDQVDLVLQQTGLPGRQLRVEITESVVAQDIAAVVPVLDALRRRGVRITMDDFGTGVSSYARLHRMPLDALKIDRAFVAAMAEGAEGRSLVRSILTLSSSLGLPAIAEGVETERQREDLLDLGCLWSQGYLFGYPMPLDDALQVSCVP